MTTQPADEVVLLTKNDAVWLAGVMHDCAGIVAPRVRRALGAIARGEAVCIRAPTTDHSALVKRADEWVGWHDSTQFQGFSPPESGLGLIRALRDALAGSRP